MRFVLQLIAEPYKGPLKPLPIHTLLTADGWRERWRRVRAPPGSSMLHCAL